MKIVLDDGAFKPYKAHPEDAGFDIMARERQIVPAHGSAIFDTGVQYCLDKMGFTNVKYYAYEIDPYAIKIALSNYPDIVQCGDAFQIRNF